MQDACRSFSRRDNALLSLYFFQCLRFLRFAETKRDVKIPANDQLANIRLCWSGVSDRYCSSEQIAESAGTKVSVLLNQGLIGPRLLGSVHEDSRHVLI